MTHEFQIAEELLPCVECGSLGRVGEHCPRCTGKPVEPARKVCETCGWCREDVRPGTTVHDGADLTLYATILPTIRWECWALPEIRQTLPQREGCVHWRAR